MNKSVLKNKHFSIREYLVSSEIYSLKCSISVILAYFIAKIIVPEDLLSATFTAILCVKPTFYSGLMEGNDQLFASLLGAIITTLLLHFVGYNIFVMSFALFIVISICINRNWNNYLVVAIFSVLYVFIIPQQTELNTIIVRILAVLCGFFTASIINFIFSLVRYQSFLHFRTSYSLNIVFNEFSKTVKANKTADIQGLDKLYSSYENVYNKLSVFATEAYFIQKELDIRKSSEIKRKEAYNISRIIENLKMTVRYLQDITFISQRLAPKHEKIPKDWKNKIDEYWIEIEKKYSTIIDRFINKEFSFPVKLISFESEIIYDVTEKIKLADEIQKIIFTETLSIFMDFQQIIITLNNLEFYIIEYLKEDIFEN
ncbi:MAG: aromatic acid exporter family protein [Cyanobacteriota bacterium]